jgi:hypothetical protein
MKYSIKKSELDQIIKEEVQRFKELKELKEQKSLIEGAIKKFEETGELDEIVGTLGKKIGNFLGTTEESKKQKLMKSPKLTVWQRKGYKFPEGGIDALLVQAKNDGFAGDWGVDEKTKTITYRTGETIRTRSMLAGGGQGGGTFAFEQKKSGKPSSDCEKCGSKVSEKEYDDNYGKCKKCAKK